MVTTDAIRIAVERHWLIGSTVRETIVGVRRDHGETVTRGFVLREFARVAQKESKK